jgi:hypothetical protein
LFAFVDRDCSWTALVSPSTAAVKRKKQADINIFTVASGLLYEVRRCREVDLRLGGSG